MALFDIPESTKPKQRKRQTVQTENKGSIKLKKGQTINDLVIAARKLVEEKLSKYKDVSKCVTDVNELKEFFNKTEGLISIDTETTGLNVFSDELVGFSVCNGKECFYIPMNHKSPVYQTRLPNQMDPVLVKELLLEEIKKPKYKWLYHNAKFDLGVFRTFLGVNMPDPYWDTMLASFLFNQTEEHSLKFQYNKYVAEEDEGVNRFDTLFKRSNLRLCTLKLTEAYISNDIRKQCEPIYYWV